MKSLLLPLCNIEEGDRHTKYDFLLGLSMEEEATTGSAG
jgi:hypothetical protein